jgi:hypothetical protein
MEYEIHETNETHGSVPEELPGIPQIRVVMDVSSIQYLHAQNSTGKPHQRYLYAVDFKSRNAFGPIELSIYFRLTPESSRISSSELQSLFKEKILWELHSNVSESSRRDYNNAEIERMRRGSAIPGVEREFLFVHKCDDAKHPFFELRTTHRGTFEILIGQLQRGFYKGKYTFISYRSLRDAINNRPITGKDPITTLDFCHDAFLKFCRYNETIVIKSTGEPHSIIVDGTCMLPLSSRPASSSPSNFDDQLIRTPVASMLTTLTNLSLISSSSSPVIPMDIESNGNVPIASSPSTALPSFQKEMFLAAYSEYEMFGGERRMKRPSVNNGITSVKKPITKAKRKLIDADDRPDPSKRSLMSFFAKPTNEKTD